MSYHIKRNSEVIQLPKRSIISDRCKRITKSVNKEFWSISSETANSFYVGSYGRGTAIDSSDIDILLVLPDKEYKRFDNYKSNGQSFLLQAVKTTLCNTYSLTDIHADGQVVKVSFSDGMKFELLPAFAVNNFFGITSYRYPDSNNNGCWKLTNPKIEQEAMRSKNKSSQGLLFDTCKHIRLLRDQYFKSFYLSGFAIDSFIYLAIGDWQWADAASQSAVSDGSFEKHLYYFYSSNYIFNSSIHAPGSNDPIAFQKSRPCFEKILNLMQS